MIPIYQSLLTPEELETYVKHGAAMCLASAVTQDPQMKKDAAGTADALSSITSLGDQGTRLLLTLSVVTGVPVGIMLHTLGKRIGERRVQDKELMDETKYYGTAAKSLESEMVRQGMKSAQSVIPKPGEMVPGTVVGAAPAGGRYTNAAKAIAAQDKKKPTVKASSALSALKSAQQSEMETGDENNDTPVQEAPSTVERGPMCGEPAALLAAVGEQPKDPGQQQQVAQGPTPNNEVVNKSNITAPGLMMTGGNTRGRS